MAQPLYPPGKTRYPLYRRLCGPQGRSGWVRNIWPPPGFDPQTVQPIAVAIPPAVLAHLLYVGNTGKDRAVPVHTVQPGTGAPIVICGT
jgi:hypothetical protein